VSYRFGERGSVEYGADRALELAQSSDINRRHVYNEAPAHVPDVLLALVVSFLKQLAEAFPFSVGASAKRLVQPAWYSGRGRIDRPALFHLVTVR
jgi:hypothetical protein